MNSGLFLQREFIISRNVQIKGTHRDDPRDSFHALVPRSR